MFNRLKLYESEIVDFAINKLIAIKAKISSQNTEVTDIDAEIASLCDKNSMISRLKARDIIDEVSFVEQTSDIQKRLTELRNRRKKLLNDDEDEACIDKFRTLKTELNSNGDYIMLFDEEIFDCVVSQIIILETGYAQFELKCGLKLKEKI